MTSQSVKEVSIRQRLILGVISLVGSLWAIATPVSAETKRLDYTLSSQENQTFAALMHQAEDLARSLVQQAFAEPSVTEVSVTIVGERNGQEAPLLQSTVSRFNWEQEPIQAWSRYFGSSAVLLGFKKPQVPESVAATPPFDEVAASMSDREPNFYR